MARQIYLILLFSLFFSFDVHAEPASTAGSQEKTLKSGWYLWDPYQYVEGGEGFRTLTGLDVQLMRAIAKKAGFNVLYEEVSWRQHLEDLQSGKRDIAAGATWTEKRAAFAYYSNPYRREENAFYMKKGDIPKYKFGDLDQTLTEIKAQNLKIGIVDGFIYADPRINQFIADPANESLIIKTANDFESLEYLLSGRVNGFFADRLVVSTIAWRTGNRDKIEELYLNIGVDIHFIFSKQTITAETVEAFNQAIVDIKETGEYGKIVKSYLLPVLLLQTIDRPWFLIIDIIGTIAFAISGLIVAYHERTTLFGALVFAALPSVGGGIVRDIIVDRKPIGVLNTPAYALIIIGTVLIGYLYTHYVYSFIEKRFLTRIKIKKALGWRFADKFLLIFDSLGQAAFTVSGVVVAVVTKSDPLWIWGPAFAALTGAGGGIIRDLLRSDNYIFALKGALYAEISILWGLIISLLLIWKQEQIDPNYILVLVVTGVIGCFVTRMITVRYNIKGIMFGEPLRQHLEKKGKGNNHKNKNGRNGGI